MDSYGRWQLAIATIGTAAAFQIDLTLAIDINVVIDLVDLLKYLYGRQTH